MTANGGESRDQTAKTNRQLAPISNADIECGMATAAHFLQKPPHTHNS